MNSTAVGPRSNGPRCPNRLFNLRHCLSDNSETEEEDALSEPRVPQDTWEVMQEAEQKDTIASGKLKIEENTEDLAQGKGSGDPEDTDDPLLP